MRLTQAQRAHVKSLEDRKGRVTARRILADARLADSPLHSLSVWRGWDQGRLAEIQLLHCARLVIASVTIQVTHNETVLKTPAYIVDTETKGDGYRSVVSLKGDTPSARESLIYTLEVAAGHLRRAYDLAVPLGVSKQIDALLEQVAGVKRIIERKKAA